MFKMKFVADVLVEALPLNKGKIKRFNVLIDKIKNCTSTTEKKKLISLLVEEDLRFVPLSVKSLKFHTLILESSELQNVWVKKYLKIQESIQKVEEAYKFFNDFNFNHTKIEPHI